MAMVIANNSAAQLTLGQLNKNISQLNNNLKKVSSGRRINNAGDDAASFAISEKMLTRIRSLEQDERNVQNGSSLVRVAAGGIDSIVDELRNLKELALNAANDTNTDIDRAILQREFDQRRSNIDSIAMETNYNGKILLDGTYSKKSIDIVTQTVIPGIPGDPGSSWLYPTDPDNVGPTGTVVHSGATEPTETSVSITEANYTITQPGVYALTSSAHNVTIQNGVHDVKFVQEAGSTLTNIHITGPADGSANLWIEDLTITNSDSSSFIQFKNSNNTLNFKGTNTINVVPGAQNKNAVIHVGGGLTVEGGTDGSGSITFNDGLGISGALIGSNGERDNISSPITVNSGTYTSVVTVEARFGAMIGSGVRSGIGNLTVNGGTFNDNSKHDVTIGSGSDTSYCGNIIVSNATITALNKLADPAIGNGAYDGQCGNITVTNSKIHIKNQTGAGIGSSYHGSFGYVPVQGNILVENTELIVSSRTGAGIGTGEGGHVSNITVNNCDLTQVVSERGEYVGRGVNGKVGTVTINGKVIEPDDPDNQPNGGGGGTPGTPGTPDQIITTTEKRTFWNPLVIHDGTKSNQAINIYINDMRTSALKEQIPDGKSMDEVSITTRHDANVALRVIDGALDYALGEATTMGAYLSRLENTASNIVTANENTISSESTIRDADMAKEMCSYARSNVLLQASQSMLTQANQIPASVLGLLQ